MCKVLLSHNKELEVGLEEPESEALGARITVLTDDAIHYGDDGLDLGEAEVEDAHVVAMPLYDGLDALREGLQEVELELLLLD